MLRRVSFLVLAAALVLVGGRFGPAGAALQAVGPAPDLANPGFPAVTPHGFPGFYQDANGLKLELCLDGDPVAALGPCIFDPVDPANPVSVASGFGAEAFYMYAQADARPLVAGGKALLILALEAAYSAGDPAAGTQMTFARLRVRFDAAVAQDYRIIHPYGVLDIPAAEAAATIAASGQVRVTVDLGGIDPANPAAAFSGALAGWDRTNPAPTPFLTWSTYPADPALQVPILDPVTGAQTGVNQYIGDGATPHAVNPGPNGNIFAIQTKNAAGAWTTVSQTDLWIVAGKVAPAAAAYTQYGSAPPVQNLWAVGPVNRNAPYPQAGSNLPSDGTNPAVPLGTDYPVGFPFWYQERADAFNPGAIPIPAVGGLQLTICPAGDPKCISAPPDPAANLNVGPEAFFWTADSRINYRSANVRLDADVFLALEATFVTGAVIDGDQMAFGRVRVKANASQPGTYTFTHPYGTVTVPVLAADVNTTIVVTEDIGSIAIPAATPPPAPVPPANPDTAFSGALFSKLNPFLRWTTFSPDPALTDANLKDVDPITGAVLRAYVGNPLIRNTVVGSPTGNNFFGVEATDAAGAPLIAATAPGARETLFAVTGKLFDPLAPAGVPLASLPPVAAADAGTTSTAAAVTINVLVNDLNVPAAGAVVKLVDALGALVDTVTTASGTAAVNVDNTVTYTPGPTAAAGLDALSYVITAAGPPAVTSNPAAVNITLTPAVPPETITLTRAQLDLRKREWNLQGTARAGSTLTIYAGGAPGGTVVGSVRVPAGGRWSFRNRGVAVAPGVTTVGIVSSTTSVLPSAPLRVR